MRFAFRSVTLVGTLLLFADAVWAQNLIPNVSFDINLSSWDPSGVAAVETVVWDPLDADGSAHSGSAKITNSFKGGSNFGLGLFSPCFAVTPGSHISYGSKVFIPPGQVPGYSAISIQYFSSPECGNFVSSTSSDGVTTTGAWTLDSNVNDTVPANAVSAALAPNFYKYGSLQDFTGHLDDAFVVPGSTTAPCVASDTTLCLNSGRYKVTAHWRSHTDSGDGHASTLTADTGTFWFFSSNNVEVIVKLVGACVDPFNRYWFFAAGLTNVEVTITVVDTESGEVRTYVNPLDQAFAAIQDTSAFATCP